MEGYDKGRPVPTRVVGTEGIAVSDTSDKLELATLDTGTIGGKDIPRDVRTDLTGRPVGINVTLLGFSNSVATPAVTVTYFVVCR